MATNPTEPEIATSDLPRFRLSLEQYHRMGESGLLAPADRVVLHDGLLVKKMTKGPRRSTARRKGLTSLEAITHAGWQVRVEAASRRLLL